MPGLPVHHQLRELKAHTGLLREPGELAGYGAIPQNLQEICSLRCCQLVSVTLQIRGHRTPQEGADGFSWLPGAPGAFTRSTPEPKIKLSAPAVSLHHSLLTNLLGQLAKGNRGTKGIRMISQNRQTATEFSDLHEIEVCFSCT